MSFVAISGGGARPEARPADWGPLRDFVQERTGVYYADNRLPLLVSRLAPLLKSPDARGAQDLLLRFRFDSTGGELGPLFDLAAPHESYFLREPDSLEALRTELLPHFEGRKKLKIWSAGCAAGEEAYSIRYSLGTLAHGLEVEIRGTDLSPRCIAQAERAEYRDSALRQLPAADAAALFEGGSPVRKVRPEWMKGVQFEVENLVETEMPPQPVADVIFCRNVMIYFSEASRRRVVELFYESLSEDGFLILGHSESLHGLTRAFRPLPFQRGLGYRKD